MVHIEFIFVYFLNVHKTQKQLNVIDLTIPPILLVKVVFLPQRIETLIQKIHLKCPPDPKDKFEIGWGEGGLPSLRKVREIER